MGTIEQSLELVRPDLNVPGHRFAVESHIVRGRAEQHMRDAVLAVGHAQFVIIPVELGPAVRAAIGVSRDGIRSGSGSGCSGCGSCIQPDCGTRMLLGSSCRANMCSKGICVASGSCCDNCR